jgi:outer membrane protein assembly factor BamB
MKGSFRKPPDCNPGAYCNPGAFLAIFLLSLSVIAADWPQFRGPGGTGVSPETGLPVRWGPAKNIRWKAELPGRGVSSPVVAGGRVYVTACSGYQQRRLHLLCFDAACGTKQWERQFQATGNTLCHPKTCMAAPTPVSDGDRVYALFATGDLGCFDRDGNLLWYRSLVSDYHDITNQVGLAASPILWKDLLIVPMENVGESFAAGLDKLCGQNRWKVERPRDINWPTPLLLEHDGRSEVLFQAPQELAAYDPATGRKLWTYTGEGMTAVPSLVAAEGLIVLSGGVALRPPDTASSPQENRGEKRSQAGPQVAWRSIKLRPAYASPLYYQGLLYAINNSGILLNGADIRTGRVIWQQRVKGPFSASPVAGDKKIYLVNEDGLTTVVRPGKVPQILSTNALGEPMLATPAIANGAIYLRSDRHLFCIRNDIRE